MEAIKLLENGLRILVTNRCNYRCFFCHSEGLDPKAQIEEQIDPELIAGFVNAGARDLTISGGEPLVAFSAVLELLESLSVILSDKMCGELEITIVTNGYLLSINKLNKLKLVSSRFRRLRFNISLHTPEEPIYNAVTRTKGTFQKTITNIKNTLDEGFEVCLNFVLLRNYNEKQDEIESILKFSSDLRVSRIKIIEFLLTDLNKSFYSSFSRLQPIIYNNRHRASEKHSNSQRKISHFYTEYNLKVDYTKCTCALGCAQCKKTREIEITPDNNVIGCICLPPVEISKKESPIQIAEGVLNQLSSMVQKYGKFSPSLVFTPENVYGNGRFPVKPSNSVKELLTGDKIRTYRKYTLYHLGIPPNSEFHFLLIEYEENTHSKLVCYKKQFKEFDKILWHEFDYLDHIYEFSRTRIEVNRKKVTAMGFTLPDPICVEEDSVLLECASGEHNVFLKRQLEDGVEHIFIEVQRPRTEHWEKGEPLNCVRHILKKYDLEFTRNFALLRSARP